MRSVPGMHVHTAHHAHTLHTHACGECGTTAISAARDIVLRRSDRPTESTA